MRKAIGSIGTLAPMPSTKGQELSGGAVERHLSGGQATPLASDRTKGIRVPTCGVSPNYDDSGILPRPKGESRRLASVSNRRA